MSGGRRVGQRRAATERRQTLGGALAGTADAHLVADPVAAGTLEAPAALAAVATLHERALGHLGRVGVARKRGRPELDGRLDGPDELGGWRFVGLRAHGRLLAVGRRRLRLVDTARLLAADTRGGARADASDWTRGAASGR